jgi:hypothetical protein
LKAVEKAKVNENNEAANTVEEEVNKFEEIIFQNYGQRTVYRYLRRALMPYIFLYGPLAVKANFLRAKLANGSYKFSALVGANISYYLPEFVMGVDRQYDVDMLFGEPNPWQVLGEVINELLDLTIEYFMDTYTAIMHTAKQRINKNILEQAGWWVGHLDPYIVKIVRKCEADTGTGRRKILTDNGEVVYEDIPEDDLVVCYDDNKFSCHSISEIMRAIARAGDSRPINENTGKPYPKDFIKKFIERYNSDSKMRSKAQREAAAMIQLPRSPKSPKTIHKERFMKYVQSIRKEKAKKKSPKDTTRRTKREKSPKRSSKSPSRKIKSIEIKTRVRK